MCNSYMAGRQLERPRLDVLVRLGKAQSRHATVSLQEWITSMGWCSGVQAACNHWFSDLHAPS